MTVHKSIHLLPPQQVASGEMVAPLQYTVNDTARILGFSSRTVLRLIDQGQLGSVGNGRLRRVPLADILAYQERNRNEVV